MIFYLAFAILIVMSLAVSLAGFAWGLKNGQFSDQDRARYLPLRDAPRARRGLKNTAKIPLEVYVLFSLAGLGLLSLVAALWILAGTKGAAHALF